MVSRLGEACMGAEVATRGGEASSNGSARVHACLREKEMIRADLFVDTERE